MPPLAAFIALCWTVPKKTTFGLRPGNFRGCLLPMSDSFCRSYPMKHCVAGAVRLWITRGTDRLFMAQKRCQLLVGRKNNIMKKSEARIPNAVFDSAKILVH